MSSGKWMLLVGAVLASAALACSAPALQGGAAPAGKQVSAGVTGEYFTAYTITVAPGWADTHETNPDISLDKLTLTRDAYSLAITQAGAGIEACIFDGAPTPTGAAQLWQEYASGVAIESASARFMRGTIDGLTYIVCEKNGDRFNSVTTFGGIFYNTPNPADPARLAEMDGMVASLTH